MAIKLNRTYLSVTQFHKRVCKCVVGLTYNHCIFTIRRCQKKALSIFNTLHKRKLGLYTQSIYLCICLSIYLC
jgi:hypothetical protein